MPIKVLFIMLTLVLSSFASPLSEACNKTGDYDETITYYGMVVKCFYNRDGRLWKAQRVDLEGQIYYKFHPNGVVSEWFSDGRNGYGDYCYSRDRYNREGMMIGSESHCGPHSETCTYSGNYRLKCQIIMDNHMWTDYKPVEYAD